MLDGGTRFDTHGVILVGLSGVLLVSSDDGVSFTPLREPDQPGFAAVLGNGADRFVLAGDRGVRTLRVEQFKGTTR